MIEDPVKITKEEINELPLRAYEGPVRLIGKQAQVAEAVGNLEGEGILGFDTESRPSFRKGDSFPVSLLQLAGSSDVYIFQVQLLENLEPIWKLLGDPEIVKAGVAIADDIRKLRELTEFEPAGFVELAKLAQDAGLGNTGLRSLAGLLLDFRISKGAQVSNWAKEDLSEAQVQYAATDAWVSRQLYLRLMNARQGD